MAAGRQYRPGTRNKGIQRAAGVYSQARRAWVKTQFVEIMLLKYNPRLPDDPEPEEIEDENNKEVFAKPEPEVGPTYRLMIPRPYGRPVVISLSGMTEPELVALREFFNYAVDQAMPIVQERDRVAADAFKEGNDSYARVYRAVPQFVIRKGQVQGDSQGILDGPEDVDPRDGSGSDSREQFRDCVPAMADSFEGQEASAEDDWQTPNVG